VSVSYPTSFGTALLCCFRLNSEGVHSSIAPLYPASRSFYGFDWIIGLVHRGHEVFLCASSIDERIFSGGSPRDRFYCGRSYSTCYSDTRHFNVRAARSQASVIISCLMFLHLPYHLNFALLSSLVHFYGIPPVQLWIHLH